VEEAPQPLVTGRVVCGIDRLVVLAEKLLALSFGEVSQDHQRIGRVFRRLCGHATQLTPARSPQPVCRTGQEVGALSRFRSPDPNDQLHRRHFCSVPVASSGGPIRLAELTKFQGAKRGANGDRHQAT